LRLPKQSHIHLSIKPTKETVSLKATSSTSQTPRRHADRREAAELALLEAAVTLIATKGVRGTTVADIGEAAGYSRGLPTHYYKSKAGLLKSVVDYIYYRFAEGLTTGRRAKRGLDSVIKLIEVTFSPASLQMAKTFSLMQKEALMPNSELRSVFQAYNRETIARIAKEIQISIDKKEIRADANPQLQATLLLAALRGIVVQWSMNPASIDHRKVTEEMIALLKRSLAIDGTKS
jgi:AcrR family transcriptional regulator